MTDVLPPRRHSTYLINKKIQGYYSYNLEVIRYRNAYQTVQNAEISFLCLLGQPDCLYATVLYLPA